MADAIHRIKKAGILSAGGFVASVAVLAFGAGTAAAEPGPTEVAAQGGIVSSPQAASVVSGKRCEVSAGTLSTASVYVPEVNVPKQTADEAGPEWVGSDAWVAIGTNPADPWYNDFLLTAPTGPQCSFTRAPGAGGNSINNNL
jgi:hypothetical protein